MKLPKEFPTEQAAAVFALLVVVVGLVFAAWDLFIAPVFRVGMLTFTEAIGLLSLLLLVLGTIYLLQDTK